MSEMWKPEVMGLEESKKSGRERVPKHLRKLVAVLEPNGPMFFGIADTLYRQVDKLTDYQVLIISLIHVPMVDLHKTDHRHLHFSSVAHHACHEVNRKHVDKRATTREVMFGSTILQTKLFPFQSETPGEPANLR